MEVLRLLAAERLTASFKCGEPAMRTAIYSGRETGEGAGAVYYAADTGRFLLCKRSDEGDAPNTWWCLGGGVDDTDESFEHTVKREAFEEGGVPMDTPVKMWHIATSQVAPDFIFHNYLAIVDSEFEPQLNEEHTEHAWVEPEELLDYPDLHEGFKAALQTEGATHTFHKRLGIVL